MPTSWRRSSRSRPGDQAVEAELTPGAGRLRARLPFTPLAHEALDQAFTVANELGHSYVGTEHQLIALAEGSGGVAAQVLAAAGLDGPSTRQKVVAALTGSPPPR